MKRQADRFGKRMERQADRQVREEDEKARRQTGFGRGWKGKLTDRFGKRMKMRADRKVRKEDEKVCRQIGTGRGWKGKETDRFGKRMKKQADRQVWEEEDKASWQTGSWIVRKNTMRGVGTGWKDKLTDKLKDRLVKRTEGHSERAGSENDARTNWETGLCANRFFFLPLKFFRFFAYFPFVYALIFAVSRRWETSEDIPFSLPSETELNAPFSFFA